MGKRGKSEEVLILLFVSNYTDNLSGMKRLRIKTTPHPLSPKKQTNKQIEKEKTTRNKEWLYRRKKHKSKISDPNAKF